VGAVPALELVLELGVDELHRHGVGLADALRDALDLAPSRSAVVALRPPVVGPDAQARLEAAGLRVSARAGNVRLAFHAWNTPDDVERVLRALRDAPAPGR
jgi:selenocysteine lyase/cysteine desulfurase